jgi:transcriptional regulator with XRE-family HTH domain
MFNIGNKITELRKAKKMSLADLSTTMAASRDIICKYERIDNLPSIKSALKLSNLSILSIDYLIGEEQHASYYKETLKRLQEIENLDSYTRKTIFQVINTFPRDFKARVAYS